MLYNNIIETIGDTPMVKLSELKEELNLQANIYAKLESFNPGGSVKDRIAANMIAVAMEHNYINSNTLIIEPTSGNTGIGLAMVCAAYGLKLVVFMPESMSIERRKLISAYGAEIRLTEASKGMTGAIDAANELRKEVEDSFIPSQFENPSNPKAHYRTAAEIIKDLDSKVDIFMAGIGTGGTVSGNGKYLKEKLDDVRIIGVEPLDSAVITTGVKGPHKIQGIGAGFIPQNYWSEYVDEVMTAEFDMAVKCSRMMAEKEGILVGISSGAVLSAAIEVAAKKDNRDKNIVVVLADNGERYLSTGLYE